MVFIKSFLEGKVHLHYYLHPVPSLLAKLGDEGAGGGLVHGIYASTADVHCELQKLHVYSLLLCPEGRIHHHQIYRLWS